jgi:hypothetical protein
MGGQRRGTGLRQSTTVERDFLPRVAHLGAKVVAVAIGQFLAGDESEPEEKRQLAIFDPLGESLVDFEVRLLKDIGRINAAEESAVQSQSNDPLEPLAKLREEFGQREFVAGLRATQQVGMFAEIICHERSHIRIPGYRSPLSTRNRNFMSNFDAFVVFLKRVP